MLTDRQITDIAREFAEEMCAHMEDDFIKDEAIKDNELTFQMAVNHLSQRYCLVEKDNIEKCFYSRKYILTHQDKYAVYIVREAEVEMRLLRCLFPEIAKEVEDEKS